MYTRTLVCTAEMSMPMSRHTLSLRALRGAVVENQQSRATPPPRSATGMHASDTAERFAVPSAQCGVSCTRSGKAIIHCLAYEAVVSRNTAHHLSIPVFRSMLGGSMCQQSPTNLRVRRDWRLRHLHPDRCKGHLSPRRSAQKSTPRGNMSLSTVHLARIDVDGGMVR